MKRRSFLAGLSASAAALAGTRAAHAVTGAALDHASVVRRENCSFVASAQHDLMLDLETGLTQEISRTVRCPLCGDAVTVDASNAV